MSKKQYVDRCFGKSGNFERVVELYEDGVIQKRRKYIEYDQAEVLRECKDAGYEEAFAHSDIQILRENYFRFSQNELFRPEQKEDEIVMYCPKCAGKMVVKGEHGSRRCYCCNCGSILFEIYDAEAPSQRSWKFTQTTGNNSIREYLQLEEDIEKEKTEHGIEWVNNAIRNVSDWTMEIMSKSNNALQSLILSVSVDNVSQGSNHTRKQFKFFYK